MKRKSIVIALLCGIFSVLAILIVIFGIKKVTPNAICYTYVDDEARADITIAKSEYYDNKLVIYGSGFDEFTEVNSCYDNMLCAIDEEFTYDISDKKITIVIDDAIRISGIYIQAKEEEYKIRYLDSNQFAMIWSEFVCDVGLTESGNIEAYYTRQELGARNAASNVADRMLAENFSYLEGNWAAENDFLTFRREDDSFYLMEGSIGNQEAHVMKSPIEEISINENEDGTINAEVICGGGSEQRRSVFIVSSDGKIIYDKYAPDIIYAWTDESIEQWQDNINYLQNLNENLEEDLALISEYCIVPVELGATTDLSSEMQLNYSQDMPYTFYNYNPEEGMNIEDFEAYGYYYGGELRCTSIDTTNPAVEIMMLHVGVNIVDATDCMVDYFEYTAHDPVSNPIDGEFVEFTHNLVHVICFIDSDTGEIRRIMAYLENLADYTE